MHTVYLALIEHILPACRQDALEALEEAVVAEHPGLYVHDWMLGDTMVAVLVAVHPDATGTPDGHTRSDHLDGWGHGFLTLTRAKVGA